MNGIGTKIPGSVSGIGSSLEIDIPGIGGNAPLKVAEFTVKPGATKSFDLPLESDGTYDFYVWTNANPTPDHRTSYTDTAISFPTDEIYTVYLAGTIHGFNFWNGLKNANNTKIRDFRRFGPIRLGNNTSYFYNCPDLTFSATDILDLTGTTNLDYLINDSPSVVKIKSMNFWDWSLITTAQALALGATGFNQEINVVAPVLENLYRAFEGCTDLDSPISFPVSPLTEISQMCYQCVKLNKPVTLLWEYIIYAYYTFGDCVKFNQDIGDGYSPNLETVEGMCYGANDFDGNINLTWESCYTWLDMARDTSWTKPVNWTVNPSLSKGYGRIVKDTSSWNALFTLNDYSNLNNGAGFIGSFLGSGQSKTNYSNLLKDIWAHAPNIDNDVVLSTDAQYDSSAVAAHDGLSADPYNWIFVDGGLG